MAGSGTSGVSVARTVRENDTETVECGGTGTGAWIARNDQLQRDVAGCDEREAMKAIVEQVDLFTLEWTSSNRERVCLFRDGHFVLDFKPHGKNTTDRTWRVIRVVVALEDGHQIYG